MDIISKAIITTLNKDTFDPNGTGNIAETYKILKSALVQEYGPDTDLVDAIETLEKKPNSAARQAMLGEEIIANRVNLNQTIKPVALALLKKVKTTPKTPQNNRTSSIPVQRPPQIEHFTGREAELAHILTNLKPGHIVELCGPPGVGKSSLVAAALWQMDSPTATENFPDGILYHNFYTQSRADIALEEIARTFGAEPIPSPYEAAQRALSNRQILLVLDGGEQADDLSGVLEMSRNCGILFTSPACPELTTKKYSIPPLPLDQAVALLKDWGKGVKRQPAELICELLGGLPLAIRLAGHHLYTQRLNAVDYLDWLRSTPLPAMNQKERMQHGVPIVLERSLSQVSELARQALAVAGLLAFAPFEEEAITKTLTIQPHQGLFAAIRGLFKQKPAQQPTPQVKQALRELSTYGLLWHRKERHQVSHPLIYAYAQQQLTPPAKVIRRLATYFMALAWEKSLEGIQGEAQLNADRPHFMKVMQECVKWKEWEAAHGMAAAVEDYLDRQGYLADRVTANEVGLIAAWQLGRPSEGAWLGNLGDTYRTMGHAKWAIEHFQKALGTARQSGNKHSEGNSLGNLGLAYRDLGQIDQAMKHLKQAHTIFEELRSPSAGLVRDWLVELEEMQEE